MHTQKGFTLIELLIVILVIAALASVLLGLIDPAAQSGKARDGVRLNTVKNLSEAIESYRQIEGAYPLDTDPTDENSTLRKSYIDKWPDPLSDDGSLDPDNWSYKYANVIGGIVLYSPNSHGGCFKYQTNWAKVMTCPAEECTTSLSLASSCN